jgi:ribosomal protein S27AE
MTAHQPTPPAVAFLESQEITTTDCRECGTQVSGVNGRYACGVCGWVNNWSEGHGELPIGDDDEAS